MFYVELLRGPVGAAFLLQPSLVLETTDLLWLRSCPQQGRHQLKRCWVRAKLLFLFSRKNCGTSGRAAKLHCHFATSTAECTIERFCVASNCSWGAGVLVHRPDMGLRGINAYISLNQFPNKCELILMRRNILFLQLLQLEHRGNKQKYNSRK